MDIRNQPPLIISTIRLIHWILIGFVLIVPFLSESPTLWDWHLKLVVTLLVKWWITGEKCGLTSLEHYLRNQSSEKEEGFIYQFLHPIINLRESKFNSIIYFIVIILGAISLHKSKKL